jgi:MFS family permease
MTANRVAVSVIFFMYGLCFASWASRIPSIQENLALSESVLGAVLFALPTGLLISLLFSGWLITSLGSKKVVLLSTVLYSVILILIGVSKTTAALTAVLFAFGFCGNLLNISINTQAVGVEARYGKNLMASFHGMWSLAGFAGAAIGTWMIGNNVNPTHHFTAIWAACFIINGISVFFLLPRDINSDEKRPVFSIPDKALLGLGITAFCSMIAEGAMFDWSGVYFYKVVNVKQELIGAGYTTFMVAMAGTRFIADRLSQKFGLRKMLQASGLFSTAGLTIAVVFPYLIPSLVGFFLVGMGVSSVVPLVYSAVGKSKTLSPGAALSAVSTLGFMGLLIGPPIIGLIAGATSLRVSFLVVACMALCVTALASSKAVK